MRFRGYSRMGRGKRDPVMAAAKRIFGTTDDPAKAGWILPDGTMLNFSSGGEKDRDLEHSEIYRAIRAVKPQFPFTSARSVVEEFEMRGAIRILSSPYGFDVGEGEEVSLYIENAEAPTPEQEATLRRLLQEHENVTVERLADTWESWGIPGKPRYHPDAVIRWMKNYDYRGLAGLGKLIWQAQNQNTGAWRHERLDERQVYELLGDKLMAETIHRANAQGKATAFVPGSSLALKATVVGKKRKVASYTHILWQRAKEEFGTTENPACAGYILPDGEMLNLCTEGQGHRDQDHRQVRPVVVEALQAAGEQVDADMDRTDAMNKFIAAGAIRMHLADENVVLDYSKKPTPEQERTLRGILEMREEAYIDLTDKNGQIAATEIFGTPDESSQHVRRYHPKAILNWMEQKGYKGLGRYHATKHPSRRDESKALWEAIKQGEGTVNAMTYGWLLPDGSQIELNGRDAMHKDVVQYYQHVDVAIEKPQRLLAENPVVLDMMARGAMRVCLSEEEGSIQFAKRPTPDQQAVIARMVRDSNVIRAEVTDPRTGRSVYHLEWGLPGEPRKHPTAVIEWMKHNGYRGLGRLDPVHAAAKKLLPATTDPRKGGWILPDGTMLDLSQGHERRWILHSSIMHAYPEEESGWRRRKFGVDYTWDFMKRGAIRIDTDTVRVGDEMHPRLVVEFTAQPTDKQEALLHQIARDFDVAIVEHTSGEGEPSTTNLQHSYQRWGIPGEEPYHPDRIIQWMKGQGTARQGLSGPIENQAFRAACADAGAAEIERAGFILPDGCLVNLDVHEDIQQYYGEERPWFGKPWWDPGHAQRRAAVDHTIMQGGIRVWMSSDTSWGGHTWTTAALELHKTPTPAQIQELRSLLKDASRVYLDTRDEKGDVTSSEEITLDAMSRGALLRKLPSMGYRGLRGRNGLAGAREDEVFERFCEERPVNERDFVGAGWLMPSGCLAQTDEHSEIHDYYPDEWKQHHERSAIDQSIANGAMRIKRTGETEGHRELAVEYGRRPTEAQVRVLQRLLKDVDEIAVDIRGPQGNIVASHSHRVDPSSMGSILRSIRKGSYKGLRRRGLGGPLEEAAFEKACQAASVPAREFGEAGFLLPNGCVVEVMGGHAEIVKYFDWPTVRRGGAEEAVARSIMAGAIRMWRDEDQNALALELHKRPTDAQLRELGTLLAGVDALYVDVVSPSGRHQVDQAVVTDLLGANKRKAMAKLRRIGYEGLGRRSLGKFDPKCLRAWSRSNAAIRLLDRYKGTQGADWGAGGCAPLARAMHRLLPDSELWVVEREGRPEHVVVKWRNEFWDYEGSHSGEELGQQWAEQLGTAVSVKPLGPEHKLEVGRWETCPTGLIDEVAASLERGCRRKGRKGLGQHIAYPAGTPEGRMHFHWDPYRFKKALQQAEKCGGELEKDCQTSRTPRGDTITTCTWRSHGKVIAAAAGTATMRGDVSLGSKGTSLWTDRDLLKGRCPR